MDKAMNFVLKIFAAMTIIIFAVSDYKLIEYMRNEQIGISAYFILYIAVQLVLLGLLVRFISYTKGLNGGKKVIRGAVHISGLPVQQGAICRLTYDKEGLIVEAKGSITHIAYLNVDSLGTRTEQEIKTTYNASILGTIAGGMLLGTAGAIIFGMPKRRDHIKNKMFYEIVYRNGSGVNRLLFQIDSDMLYRINILNGDIEWRADCKVN